MAKDDLSVKINVGFDVNKNELDQAKQAIAAIKAEIESANNLRLKVSPSGGASGNPVALQPLEAMLKKAVSGGGKSDFKKIQLGLFEKIDESLVSTTKNYIDGLNKSSKDKAVSSKSFLPAIEQINEAIDGINSRVLAYAKAFDLTVNKELKFKLFDDADLKVLETGLDVDLSSGVQKVSSMLKNLEAGLDLNEDELKTAFDFKAIKDNTTLALSPAMFESLFKVIMQEAGEYVLNGNVFKGFENNEALARYEKSRDPKAAMFQKDRFTRSSETGLNNFYKTLNNLDPAKTSEVMQELGIVANKKLEDTLLNAVKAFGKSLAGGKDFKAFAAEIQETGQSIEGFVAMQSNVNNLANNYQNFKEIVAEQEELSGFKPGTLGANVGNLDISKIVGERLTMLPQGMIEDWLYATYKQLTTEIITHAKDASGNIIEVLNTEMMSQASLPEAGAGFDSLIPQVAKRFQPFIQDYDATQLSPLSQALEEPGILTKGLNSESEKSVKASVTKLLNARYKRLSEEFDQAVIEVEFSEESKALPSGRKALGAGKAEAQDFAKDFFNAMRGGEFEQFKGELKGSIQELEQQKVWRRAFGNAPMAEPARSSSLQDYDAASPDLARLEAFLRELTQDGSKGSYAGMDTEHFNTLKDGVTELGIVMENGAGQLVDIFKFIQIPTDTNQMAASWDKLNAGNPAVARTQAKTVDDLLARAGQIGVPVSKIGTTVSPEKNAKAAVESYTKLAEILELFAKYNVTLTGVKIDEADVTPIKRTIDYINSISGELGAGQIPNINFGTPFDPSKKTKQLANPNFANQPGSDVLLSEIFRTNGKESAALGNLIQRIAQTEPAWLKQFESQFTTRETQKGGVTFDYMPQGGTPAGAHFAISDAAASVIALKFIEQYGSDAARDLLTPVAKNANVELEKQKRAAVTSSSGGGAGEPPVKPADSKGGMDDRDPSKITSRIILTARELDGALVSVANSMATLGKQSFPILEKMTEAELATFNKRITSSTTHLQIVNDLVLKENELAKSRQELKDLTQGDAGFTLARRSQGLQGPQTQTQALFEAQGGIERFDDQAKAVAKLKLEVIDLTQAARENEIQTAKGVVEELRKGAVTEQLTNNLRKQVDMQIETTQAGKDATAQIKNQMQEQVNAQKAVQRQTQSLMNTWVTSRYALYDIGNFYQSAAQNLIRVSRQIFDTTQSYRRFETAFTSVERAMQLVGSSTKDVRDQFILLSETTPVAFEDIARIGTLGAQMGITAQGIIGFTETVAKFSAITGISAETVAQQFGKIAELANVDPTQFENLGSAVAFAGVNAVATEAEILNLTQSIAAVSSQAGITAPEIVGIATALASVGIQAEQSRGVFTRVFADIDRAAQGGGKSLQALSEVTGLSAKQISGSWGKEGAANEVFIALLKGLDASDNLTATFDKLNIVETREINTLTRLAKNLDVVMQALADSNMSFEDALFLGESFDKTVDNLDSKISLFKNNVDSLAAALSGSMAVALGNIVDIGSEFLKFLKNAENSFFFTGIAPNLFIFGVLGAGIAGFAAILAKTTAQVYAFRVAVINSLNNPTAVTGIVAQTKALFGFGSGLIEVRDQVSGISERGLIEPINFKSMFGGAKSQQKELLELRNIYMSMGDAAKQAMGEEKARSYSAIELSRMEADAANTQLLAKRLEIETLENSLNPEDVAKAATMRTAYSQAYVVAVGTEIKVLTAAQLQTEKSVVSSSNLSRAKKAEAMAHLNNAQAVNLETKAAAGGVGKVGGMIGKAVGIIGILTTAIMLAEMLGSALGQIGKIDLTESGGGMESFREAIKEDTLAVKEGTMEAVATAEIEYNTYRTEVDKTATAIGKITGVTGKVADGFRKVTKQINTQNISLGENSKKWLANAIFNNPELKKWRESDPLAFDKMQETLLGLGMTFDGVLAGFVKNAEGSDVNPLAPLQKQLENFEAEKARILSKNKGSGRLISDEDNLALTGVMDQIDTIKKTLNMFNAVKSTIVTSISEDGQKAAINKMFDVNESGILKLIDAYKKASETGKGMAKVVSKVKIESISMLKEIDGLNPKLEIDINAQETVQGIYAVLEAAIKAKENLYVMSGALDKVGTSAAWTGAVSMAAIIAKGAGTENDRKILQDLMIMINSLGSGLDKIDGSGAALTIAELIALANEGTVGIMNFREAIRSLGKTMKENQGFDLNTASGATNTQAILAVLDAIGTKSGITMKKALNNTKVFKLVLQDMGAPAAAIALVDNVIKKLGGSSAITAKEGKRLRKEFAFLFESFQTNLAAGAAEAVDSVENKIRSLTDFVSDLRGVLQSAFEVRYGAQTGLDAITSAWSNLTQAAKDAEKAVKSANDEINQSLADKTVLQYQLSVAQRYNDEKRSAVIRAKLAKLDQQILDQQQQLAEANGANDKSLTGNTKSAIDNRAKVRDLVTQYNSYLLSLANTNMSSTDLAAKAKELEADFLAQGLALGYAEAELKTYTQAFAGDFTTVLAGVPRDITITVNTDPALRAIEEFAAKAREALSTIVAPVAAIAPVAAGMSAEEEKRYANLFRTGEANTKAGPDIMGRPGEVVKGPKGTTWAWDSKGKEWDRVAKKAMGGYVSGPGGPTSDSIPAMLSNGEYVINSRSVGAYGLDFMNALNQQRVGFAPTQGSFNGGSSGGSQMVYLSPEDRALLRAAVDRPIALYTENAKIAQSANAGNVLLAQRGTN